VTGVGTLHPKDGRGRVPAAELKLGGGSRVGVVGGGPAGSFFGNFLLSMARQAGVEIGVDIYGPRDFALKGACGCNKRGGIIYESLVQSLATDGIFLPSSVVQQGISGYTFHTDEGSVRIRPPGDEKRIASVRRGGGPCGAVMSLPASFDGFLQSLAEGTGARIVRERVTRIEMVDGRPRVATGAGDAGPYDLLVGAMGVNSPDLKIFEGCGTGYAPPRHDQGLHHGDPAGPGGDRGVHGRLDARVPARHPPTEVRRGHPQGGVRDGLPPGNRHRPGDGGRILRTRRGEALLPRRVGARRLPPACPS
jgi:hypothetical protein